MLILTFTPVSNNFANTLGNAPSFCELSQTSILRSTKKKKIIKKVKKNTLQITALSNTKYLIDKNFSQVSKCCWFQR